MKLSFAFFLSIVAHAHSQFKAQSVQCGAPGELRHGGSSTIAPLAIAWGLYYTSICPGVSNYVGGNGSTAGAGRVCNSDDVIGGEVAIGNMARPWYPNEGSMNSLTAANTASQPFIYSCLKGDVTRDVAQIAVAYDGMTLFSKKNSPAAACIETMGGLSLPQLRWMFSSYSDDELKARGWDNSVLANSDNNSNTHLWSELHPSCPAVEIQIAGPGDASGTHDFFKAKVLTDFVNGETFRNNYISSEEDNEIRGYVTNNPAAIGYFGYTYDEQHLDWVYTAAIDNGIGTFVKPSVESIGNGSYNQLRRTLYMNLLISPSELPITVPYMEAGLSQGEDITKSMGFVPLTSADKAEMMRRLADIY